MVPGEDMQSGGARWCQVAVRSCQAMQGAHSSLKGRGAEADDCQSSIRRALECSNTKVMLADWVWQDIGKSDVAGFAQRRIADGLLWGKEAKKAASRRHIHCANSTARSASPVVLQVLLVQLVLQNKHRHRCEA